MSTLSLLPRIRRPALLRGGPGIAAGSQPSASYIITENAGGKNLRPGTSRPILAADNAFLACYSGSGGAIYALSRRTGMFIITGRQLFL